MPTRETKLEGLDKLDQWEIAALYLCFRSIVHYLGDREAVARDPYVPDEEMPATIRSKVNPNGTHTVWIVGKDGRTLREFTRVCGCSVSAENSSDSAAEWEEADAIVQALSEARARDTARNVHTSATRETSIGPLLALEEHERRALWCELAENVPYPDQESMATLLVTYRSSYPKGEEHAVPWRPKDGPKDEPSMPNAERERASRGSRDWKSTNCGHSRSTPRSGFTGTGLGMGIAPRRQRSFGRTSSPMGTTSRSWTRPESNASQT